MHVLFLACHRWLNRWAQYNRERASASRCYIELDDGKVGYQAAFLDLAGRVLRVSALPMLCRLAYTLILPYAAPPLNDPISVVGPGFGYRSSDLNGFLGDILDFKF